MTDQQSAAPTWGITTPPTRQWQSQSWSWYESKGWGDNVAWTGQGDAWQTWIGPDMEEKTTPAANVNDDEPEHWQKYVQSKWDEAQDDWGNPARGNGPTPGASSSSSDLAWRRYR